MPKYPITPEFMQELPEAIVVLYERLADYLIADICSRFKYNETATATTILHIKQLLKNGYDLDNINRYIKKTLKLTDAEFSKAWSTALGENQRYFDTIVTDQSSFDREAFDSTIEAIRAQTHGMLKNITQTMGFAVRIAGRVQMLDLDGAYERVLDDALMKVQSGISYNVAIREATKQLTDSGVQYIEYASGWHNRVDVAARRAVMTGVTQMSRRYSDQSAELLETPYREVSAHRGARDKDYPNPWSNHKKWQGRVYSIREKDKYPSIYTVCGLDQVDGLCGANCRHTYFPYVEGVTERTYTDEELENLDPPPFEFEGKKYTMYEATQKQRQIETALRKVKREAIAAKAIGDDETYTSLAVRYKRLNDEYHAFSKTAGLREQLERGNIAEFGSKEASAVQKAAKSIANSANNAIIQDESRHMANGMRKPASHILTSDEIESVVEDAKSIEIPTEILKFNAGTQTGFSDDEEIIHVRGDIFPDLTTKNVRDRMSARAVLAHEYYGHYKNHPSEYKVGDWRDEFRASREAAINTPNLTDEERAHLMIDAYDRAKEALQVIEYDEIARRIIYGYE